MKFSEIVHHPDKEQFTMTVEGQIAKIDYVKRDDALYLVHSEVPLILRGKGVGKELVKRTYEFLSENGMKAVPVCSFIRTVVARNPQ